MTLNQQHRLWTPIANALEVYRRRLIAAPDAVYEHIWRIIHIEEAMIVFLGSAFASRLHSLWIDSDENSDSLNDLCSKLTGLRLSEDNSTLEAIPARGCWSGSIDAWTDLMRQFARQGVDSDCAFCNELGKYLEEEPDNDIALIDAWQRISPIPQDIFNTRIGRLKAINSLRNKIAHVPVSHKLLDSIHKGLRQEILGLLSTDKKLLSMDTNADITTTKWHAPLVGHICKSNASVTGSAFLQSNNKPNTACNIIWYEWKHNKKLTSWSADPFVALDEELKAMLLFRVVDKLAFEGDPDEHKVAAEYYRFGAEMEPVQKVNISRTVITPWLPRIVDSQASEESITNETSPSDTPDNITNDTAGRPEVPRDLSNLTLKTSAYNYYRHGAYSEAAQAFDTLADRGESAEYNHESMLRHGESIWKSAEDNDNSPADHESELHRSIAVLDKAKSHADLQHASQAHYQCSKALRRLWLLTDKASYYEKALKEASAAARMVFEQQYINWYERILFENPADLNS